MARTLLAPPSFVYWRFLFPLLPLKLIFSPIVKLNFEHGSPDLTYDMGRDEIKDIQTRHCGSHLMWFRVKEENCFPVYDYYTTDLKS